MLPKSDVSSSRFAIFISNEKSYLHFYLDNQRQIEPATAQSSIQQRRGNLMLIKAAWSYK